MKHLVIRFCQGAAVAAGMFFALGAHHGVSPLGTTGRADLRQLNPTPNQIVSVKLGPFPVLSSLPNINVNPTGNSNMQGETSVAIDPKNPNIVIAGSNDDRSNHTSPSQYIYLSTDGGSTWINKAMPAGSSSYFAVTDPSLTYDANGVAYFCFGQFTGSSGPTAVTVQRSLDGGINWDSPVIVYSNTNGTLEDKYIVAADASATSAYKNNVYVSWTHFYNNGNADDIWVSRSTNRGANWQAPVQLSSSTRGHLSMPAIGPNGEVYVVWSEKTGILNLMMARSTNGGVSFSAPTIVGGQPVNSLPDSLGKKGDMRMITYPIAAVDNSTVHTGRLYVTWAALNAAGVPHVYLTYSDNKGVSWTPTQVIDGDPTSRKDKFHPWITVDPKTGAVAVTFYDSRNDASNVDVDLYIAISRDGGQSFAAQRVTNTSFGITPTGGYWADYTGVAAYGGKVIPCWTDQRGGSSVQNTDVYVSIIGLGPSGVANLASSITPQSPQTIGLTWVDPTTELGGAPLTQFNIVIFRDSLLIATVPKGTQKYTDQNLQTGSLHTYQVYVAAGLDTSPVATTSAAAGGDLTPLSPSLLAVRETAEGAELTWRLPSKHVDGTTLYDLSATYVFVDGVRVFTINQAPGDTGTVVTRNFGGAGLQLGKFHNFSIVTGTQRLGLTALSARTDSMYWYAGAPKKAFTEGFESAPAIGTNGAWNASTAGAHGGTHALLDNTQLRSVSRQNTWAIVAPFIVQATAPQLSFWHVAIVATLDSAIAEYSIDHGGTWHTLGVYTQAAGGFTDSIKTSTWKNVVYDMSSRVGDTVALRFRLKTGFVGQKRGWFVDDITMQKPQQVAVHEILPTPSLPLLVDAYPNPFTESAQLTSTVPALAGEYSSASLVVFDVAGRVVADLTSQLRPGAPVRARFDAADHPAGMYLARLRIGAREGVARFLLRR